MAGECPTSPSVVCGSNPPPTRRICLARVCSVGAGYAAIVGWPASSSGLGEPSTQPGHREAELARDGIDVDAADGGDLVLGQSAEVVQLDDAGLALIELDELVERLVQREELS